MKSLDSLLIYLFFFNFLFFFLAISSLVPRSPSVAGWPGAAGAVLLALMDGLEPQWGAGGAVLTDGRPPRWQRMLVPASPARASDGGVLRSCMFWGEEGRGRQCPLTGTGSAVWPDVCIQSLEHRCGLQCRYWMKKNIVASLIKSYRALFFPLFLSQLSSLSSSISPCLSFPFALFLPSSSCSSPSFSSLLIYPLDEGKVEFPFSDQVHLAHLSLPASRSPTAAQATAHPACFRGEHVRLPNCTTLCKNGESVSFFLFPGLDALNSPSHVFSIAFNVVISPKIIQSRHLSWQPPAAVDPTGSPSQREGELPFFSKSIAS